MTDRPSEPDLPPEYVAVHRAVHRLTRAEGEYRRRLAIEQAMLDEQGRIEMLRVRLRGEQAEVEEAERRAGRRSLGPVKRRRRRHLAAERADVEAIRSELTARLAGWQELSMSLGPAPGPDRRAGIVAAEAELDAALAAWQAAHQAAGTALGRRLEVLDRQAGELAALLAEVDEAVTLAEQAETSLLHAADAVLNTTTLWDPSTRKALGPWLTLFFRHRPSSAAAEIAVGRLQRWLLHLDGELADLRRPVPTELAPPAELALALEGWASEAYSSRLVHGPIALPLTTVADCRDLLIELREGLATYGRLLRDLAVGVEERRRTALLQHPGIVE